MFFIFTYHFQYVFNLKHSIFWPSADVKPMKNDLWHAMYWQCMYDLCVCTQQSLMLVCYSFSHPFIYPVKYVGSKCHLCSKRKSSSLQKKTLAVYTFDVCGFCNLFIAVLLISFLISMLHKGSGRRLDSQSNVWGFESRHRHREKEKKPCLINNLIVSKFIFNL